MSDRPILFSAPMVKALLDGRKTQTRRIATASNLMLDGWPIGRNPAVGKSNRWRFDALDWSQAWVDDGPSPAGNPGPYWHVPCLHPEAGETTHRLYPKWQKGDQLWVKETWLPDPSRDDDAWDDWECSPVEFDGCGLKPSMVPPALRNSGNAIFAADPKWTIDGLRWKPSIHMPRWASRLTLTVTDVRVQRVQEISEEDARAEGALRMYMDDDAKFYEIDDGTYRCGFCGLWAHINGIDAWDSNPWIVALTFTVEPRNIDAARAA